VVAQYYTFFRLGRAGYQAVQQASRDIAVRLAGEIEATGAFRLISRGDQVPAFAFTTAAGETAFDVFDVSRRLRERGWLVPAYTFPADRTDLSVLRIVVRNGFTQDLAELLLADLRRLLPELRAQPAPLSAGGTGFHH
jgi:glutamate decarboxylase